MTITQVRDFLKGLQRPDGKPMGDSIKDLGDILVFSGIHGDQIHYYRISVIDGEDYFLLECMDSVVSPNSVDLKSLVEWAGKAQLGVDLYRHDGLQYGMLFRHIRPTNNDDLLNIMGSFMGTANFVTDKYKEVVDG